MSKKETYIVKWYWNKEKTFSSKEEAYNFAYQKWFYYSVTINGVLYQRPF